VLQSLVVTLVFYSRLNYRSETLAGLPKQVLDRLQSVQNAAARLIFTARRQDHVQPLKPLLRRIAFQMAVLVLLAASTALQSGCRVQTLHPATWRQISSASLDCDCALQVRQHCQHLSVHELCVLPSTTVPFRQLPHLSGTVCRSHRHHCQFSQQTTNFYLG